MLAATSISVTLAVTLLLIEVILRFMPVNSGLKSQPVTQQDPVFHFQANRDSAYSQGWKLAYANRVHVNNAGFVNDVDYHEDHDTPLLAVIGDSYIEGLIVPSRETLQARLADTVDGAGRVYSFAASGAPLSQYLIWAQYAYEQYGADAAVFLIVSNDFDESLAKYKTGPGFHHFVGRDGAFELQLFEYHPNEWRWIAYASALGRYLIFNLQIQRVKTNFLQRLQTNTATEAPAFVGNTAADASPERIADSERAVEAFFTELSKRVPLGPGKILFIVDGIRIYDPAALAAASDSYFDRMRRHFIAAARSRDYEVIDMEPIFSERNRIDGRRFEHAEDAHWNSLAHGLAARAVTRSDVFARVFPGAATSVAGAAD
jgi:hypothetical protein